MPEPEPLPKRQLPGSRRQRLPGVRSLLAVCAHPDDESFGLGAVLSELGRRGAQVGLLCFTRGEASRLGVGQGVGGLAGASLAQVRSAELEAAAAVLGLSYVELREYPDGHLDEVGIDVLAADVGRLVGLHHPELVLVFDTGGVSGHSDHHRATQAALAGSNGLPVLAWALADSMAGTLNSELGTNFVGRAAAEVDITVKVDRSRQREAIACHHSQVADNPVLWRRLELQGDWEQLRWLRPPPTPLAGTSL